MENQPKSNRMHPLVAGAAVSVMLVSLVGVAAITGMLPNSNSTTPVAVIASAAPGDASNTIAAASASGNTASAIATLAPTTETRKFSASSSIPAAKPAALVQHHPQPAHAPQPMQAQNSQQYDEPVQVARAPLCSNCGTIESIHAVQQQAQANNGIGAVAGAVLGGILGNQVGGGNGRKLATVAGAVGGGFAGNEVEKRTRTTSSYEIRVRMEDGSSRSFSDSGQSGWQSGDRVKVVNGSLTSQE